MKIKDLIKIMQERTDQDEEIIVAWWEKNFFDVDREKPITDDEWLQTVKDSAYLDFQDIADSLDRIIDNNVC